ncbi:hypothetical protein K3495_g16531, partial [Podosphaera aphanis]
MNSNSSRIYGTGAGFRYRDIDDSNWRSKTHCHTEKELNETSGQNIEEITYEQFTGAPIIDTGRHVGQSMSVILGVEKEIRGNKMQASEKKVRFDDYSNMERITLESFLNQGDFRKRGRPLHIDELLNKEESEPKIRNKRARQREQKVLRHLREI